MNLFKKNHQDCFLWPIIALPSLVLVIFNVRFSFYSDQDFEMFWIGAALTVIWFFIMLTCSFFFQWHDLSKKTISCALSLVCLWPSSVLLAWVPIGDYIHLAAAYPTYETKIGASPNTRLQFNWGRFGFVSTVSADRTLVYDPADKLPQENEIKNAELREKTCKQSGDVCWSLNTKQLIGHFYLVTEWH
jgi:hypothetical protein